MAGADRDTTATADSAQVRPLPAAAIWIIGAIGIVVPLVSFVAIALSVVTLRRASQSHAPARTQAISGLILGAIGIVTSFTLLAVVLVYSAFTGIGAQQAACADKMRKIGQALMLYAHEDRRMALPPDLATLARVRRLPPELFIDSAATNDANTANGAPPASYVYPWRSGWNATIAPSTVLLYEPNSNHDDNGANFMFGDTSIKWFDAAAAQAMIRQIEAGTNPPRP